MKKIPIRAAQNKQRGRQFYMPALLQSKCLLFFQKNCKSKEKQIGGTLVCRGAPVEKHWPKESFKDSFSDDFVGIRISIFLNFEYQI